MIKRTEKEIAKEMVNKVYQPTGFLKHNENSDTMWEWSKNRVIEFLDYLIDQTVERSGVWLHHVKIKKEVIKL